MMLEDLIAQMMAAIALFLLPPTEPAANSCTGYEMVAVSAGWEIHQFERINYIMWRESRCDTTAHNADDPNSGSYGLMQINGYWCRPSRYFPDGWLQTQGILETCADLHNPHTNLVAARAIYEYGVNRGNCPWGPWTTRNTNWC